MTIHEKILAVQSALKAPKSQQNTFGKYKYRSCEDILEALKPLLKENGLVLTLSDEIVMIGTRFYVKATAMLSARDDARPESDAPYSTEVRYLSVAAYAREEEDKKGMDGSQITGAASSYARKYALNGLFLIDDTKDSDATNTHDKEKKPPVSELDQLKRDIFMECGKDLTKVRKQMEKCGIQGEIKTVSEAKKVLGSLIDPVPDQH